MHTVIIGNSAAALAALDGLRRFRRLRRTDAASALTLVAEEPGPAYSRVLLPYCLRGALPWERVFIRTQADYARAGARTRFGERVERVDTAAGRLQLAGGERLPYDRLLLTTGARPTLPPVPGLAELMGTRAFHLWTLEDARRLEAELRPGRRALVLGSGFIALQAAWAACVRGARVTVYELEARIMPTALDETGAQLLARRLRAHGVEPATGVRTEGFEVSRSGAVRVLARDRAPLEVDLVIVGAGVRPNVELLEGSAVRVERGVPVDEFLGTGVEGVFAAGDVAAGPTAFGETHVVHALWSTAVEHGRIAGANLAGARERYAGSLNMNVTEMFGLTVASMGRFSGKEAAVAADSEHWQELDPEAPRYLRIRREGGVPVGAVAVGPVELAAVLGRLRPHIRRRRPVADLEGFVAGKVPWNRTALREPQRCAS